MENNFKLLSLEISNIKNVDYGKIDFTYKSKILNVVGIYGQNGSGKTTVIESIDLVRTMLLGESMESKVLDLLELRKDSQITVQFCVNNQDIVEYSFKLTKKIISEEKGFEKKKIERVVLLNESLKYKEVKKNARFTTLLEYIRIDDENIKLIPKSKFPMNTPNNIKKFFVASAISKETRSSFIFGENMNDYMDESNLIDKKSRNIYYLVRRQLPLNMFIYTNRLYGMINAELVMPFLFAYKTEDGQTIGTIPLDINKRDKVSIEHFTILNSIIKQINIVLPSIIPGIEVKIVNLGDSLDDDGTRVINVEFVSSREGKEFPFRCESDGIKKIVSILSSLINLYGMRSAIVLIDEFDSGIYEYLLGEIIEIIDKNAKGQLIFTSHNLRPLEVLKDKEIIFTTVNKSNRYVRSGSIKNTNNLRNVYLRKIQVGGEQDALYNETDSFTINRSFKKASKTLINENANEEVKENGRN